MRFVKLLKRWEAHCLPACVRASRLLLLALRQNNFQKS